MCTSIVTSAMFLRDSIAGRYSRLYDDQQNRVAKGVVLQELEGMWCVWVVKLGRSFADPC